MDPNLTHEDQGTSHDPDAIGYELVGRKTEDLTIACCLWGNFPDEGWSDVYVKRLRDSVARNLSRPHKFICFADRPLQIAGVEWRALKPPSWRGNLPKTFVYSPDAGLNGRVILFDLDNVIVGSLDDMAAYRGPICVRGRLTPRPRLPDGDMISFDASQVSYLWEAASRKDIEAITTGRERFFINYAAPKADHWQDVCPGQVVSYRYEAARVGLSPRVRVVSFHGRPRPHEVTERWVREHWR